MNVCRMYRFKRMVWLRFFSCLLVAAGLLLGVNMDGVSAQSIVVSDPGVRVGPQPIGAAGNPFLGLPLDQGLFWSDALTLFKQTASVAGTLNQEPLVGLGPAFNGNSCVLCHSQPVAGGSSTFQN
ncbi:MAG TPA: hypothetical protein VFR24_22330, partial [Candidatus Angelobacter sp.]|nr:hypothetical protein [Candidatus Angelobacter sp.]